MKKRGRRIKIDRKSGIGESDIHRKETEIKREIQLDS